MTKISIIIPVYNVASYLSQCLESIRKQTLKDIEVLIIDDHGEDDSVSIARNFIQKFQLQTFWHIYSMPQNGGPGVARNEGLKHASGEYVAFVDADDWVEPEMCEKFYNLCLKKNADIGIANAYVHKNESIAQINNPVYHTSHSYMAQYVAYLWTYLFKRSFLLDNQITFPAYSSAEDSFFIAAAVMQTNNVVQTKERFYHYIIYPTSISHQKNKKRYRQKLRVFADLIRYARNRNLLSKYRLTLCWVYFKKALVTSFVDYFAAVTAR